MGKISKERQPKNNKEAILEVQTIQPNATPTVFETPKIDSIPASAAG